MERDDLILKMRGRVAQRRRLARSTTDTATAAVLHQMADEVEADIARVLKEKQKAPPRSSAGLRAEP